MMDWLDIGIGVLIVANVAVMLYLMFGRDPFDDA